VIATFWSLFSILWKPKEETQVWLLSYLLVIFNTWDLLLISLMYLLVSLKQVYVVFDDGNVVYHTDVFPLFIFSSSIKSMNDNPLSSLMLVLKKPHYLWLLRMKSWCGIHPRRWTPLFPKIHIGYRRWVWRPNKQLLQLLMDSFCSFGTITFELIRK